MEQIEIKTSGGHLAVKVAGEGPLVVCVPGMGETHASFRHLTPSLVQAGYQVATMDLRGHGESSVMFDAYDDEAAAADILTVINALGGAPAVVIGNSMGAAAAALAATHQPSSVSGIVMIGPFVRDHGSTFARFGLRLLLLRPWGPTAWKMYHRTLFGETRPVDHDEHFASTHAQLKRPGRWRAFQRTTRTSHAAAEAVLGEVAQPSLVIMGSKDRDFKDPEAEATWTSDRIGGRYVMIDGAGHYPQAEQPELTAQHIIDFLQADHQGDQ